MIKDPIKKILALIMVLTIAAAPCAGAGSAYAETDGTDNGTAGTVEQPADDETGSDTGDTEEPVVKQKANIKVTGLLYSRNAKAKTVLHDTIRVTGAYGKSVKLQRMNKNGSWSTVRSFPVKGKKNAAVVLAYPARSKTYTYWRIHIDGDEATNAYDSKLITVTSRNIKGISLNARSAVIYCMDDGQVIYGKNMTKKRPMASTTKIMTAVVVMENIDLNKKKVRVSGHAARTPYRNLYMRRGDRYYAKDLFRAMLVSSSNDSARALAESTAGSSRKFVKKMNAKAKKLKLSKTHYTDEVGFGSITHRSSAKDLARLMTYAYQKKAFRTSINRKTYSFRNVKRTRRHKVWSSSYPMYSFSKNYLGGKTGTTSLAGCCFVAVYRYAGKTYVAVNLGSRNNYYRWRDSKRMYKYIRKYGSNGRIKAAEKYAPEEPEEILIPDGDVPDEGQGDGEVMSIAE